jgi:hypothetical protein
MNPITKIEPSLSRTKHTKAHFPVLARLDMASQLQKGTVTIDRTTDLISVRPYHRKRVYSLPLSFVAEWLVRHVITSEVSVGKKKTKRTVKRGLL